MLTLPPTKMNETTENNNGTTATNLINAEDLDEEIEEKLRGDAIGETMYSQSFVAKTLLKLSEVEWNEQFEEDLCSLWDMTVERDVCEYLFELAYPSIASLVVKTYTEERLLEIVVGILANIFCANCPKTITDEETTAIFSLFNCTDPLILLQVVRFVKALSVHDESLSFLNREMVEKFTFILANSLNSALLTNCLDALAALCSHDEFIRYFLTAELYESCLNAYQTIISKHNTDLIFESTEIQTIFTNLMRIITGFCTYIDLTQDEKLLAELHTNNETLVGEVRKVLQFYVNDYNLLPVTDTFKFFIESFGYTFPILRVGYDGDVFRELMSIVIMLIENNGLETDDFSDLLCYLVCNADLVRLRRDSEKLEERDVVMVLNMFRGSFEACDNEICKQILAIYSNK